MAVNIRTFRFISSGSMRPQDAHGASRASYRSRLTLAVTRSDLSFLDHRYFQTQISWALSKSVRPQAQWRIAKSPSKASVNERKGKLRLKVHSCFETSNSWVPALALGDLLQFICGLSRQKKKKYGVFQSIALNRASANKFLLKKKGKKVWHDAYDTCDALQKLTRPCRFRLLAILSQENISISAYIFF